MTEGGVGSTGKLVGSQGERDYNQDAGAGTLIKDGFFPGMGRNLKEREANFATTLAGLHVTPPLGVDQQAIRLLYSHTIPDLTRNPNLLKNLSDRVQRLVDQGKLGGIRSLSDGMGGMKDGHIASSIGTWAYYEAIARQVEEGMPVSKATAETAIHYANAVVTSWNKTNRSDSGATFIGALTDAQGKTYLSHVGDSRAYRWDDEELTPVQITADHSALWMAMMTGTVDPFNFQSYPQRNEIVESLGSSKFKPTTQEIPASDKPWTLIMCSDGVWEGIDVSQYQQNIQQFRQLYDQERRTPAIGPVRALQRAQGRILSLITREKRLGLFPTNIKPDNQKGLGRALVNSQVGKVSGDNMMVVSVRMEPVKASPKPVAVPQSAAQRAYLPESNPAQDKELAELLAISGNNLPRFDNKDRRPLNINIPNDRDRIVEILKQSCLERYFKLFVNRSDITPQTQAVTMTYNNVQIQRQFFPTFFRYCQGEKVEFKGTELDRLTTIFRQEAKLYELDAVASALPQPINPTTRQPYPPDSIARLEALRNNEIEELTRYGGDKFKPKINDKTGMPIDAEKDSFFILQTLRKRTALELAKAFTRSNSWPPNVSRIFLGRTGSLLGIDALPLMYKSMRNDLPYDFREAGKALAILKGEAQEWLNTANPQHVASQPELLSTIRQLVSENRDPQFVIKYA